MRSKEIKILRELKDGNPSAYKDLFDLFYMPLCLYSFKYCDSFQISEDIVQDLFVKIWEEKTYLKLEGAISPYLFKSVKNNTLQVLKKHKKYNFEDIEHQIFENLEDYNLELQDIEDEKIKLYREIEALPEKSKEVFKAIVLNNMKYKEVAEYLGISVNTVKTHYARALKQLRKSLHIILILLLG